MNRIFLPFITNDQGKSLVLEEGNVVPKPMPDPIDNSPEGWEQNVIQFTRNTEFLGIVKAYTTTLKFFRDAATILRSNYYKFGCEIVLFFIWLKLDQSFGGGMKYKDWYKGEIDFTTFNDNYDSVEVNIIEGGFYKDVQANKNVPYEIPFDDDSVSIEMDGFPLFNKLTYQIAPDVLYEGSATKSMAIPFIVAEGTNLNIETGSETAVDYINFATLLASDNWMIKNSGTNNQDIHITGAARFYAPENGTLPLSFVRMKFLKNSSDPNFNGWTIYSGNPVANQLIEKIIDFQITLLPGERLFLTQQQNSVNYNLFNITFVENSFIYIDFGSKKDTTIIDAMRTFDVGNKLCLNMSKNISTLNSDLLSTDFNLLITSGDAIRSIQNAVIKTKFSDWNKSVNAVKCTSFGIENNNGKFEKRIYAFSDSEIANLGVVKIVEKFVTPANQYRYSGVEVGYPTKDIENLNGKYSFNNTLVFKTPKLKGGENIYDAKSVYYADPYIIEILRINTGSKITTDNKSDNDVFFIDGELKYNNYIGQLTFTTVDAVSTLIINVIGLNLIAGVRFKVLEGNNSTAYKIVSVKEQGPNTVIQLNKTVVDEVIDTTIEFLHYKLRRKPYLSIEGIPAEQEIFNIELSPKRILTEHYSWLAGACDKMENGMLTYQTTEKNSQLVTTDLNNVVIKEIEDVPIANLGQEIFLPHFFNVEAKSQLNLYDKIKTNPGGYFSFSVNNFTFTGFIDEVKSNEATLETQEYILLCKAGNDLETLINNR